MTRPWMQLYTRDWLDNKELRRCSPLARAVLVDLMCLAHEGRRYGYIEDEIGPLAVATMAHRCHLSNGQFLKALAELQLNHRIQKDGESLMVPRMVRDEAVRLARASGGKQSVGHPNTHPPKVKQGYPSVYPSVEIDSRARMRAVSESVSVSPGSVFQGRGAGETVPSYGFPEFWRRWCEVTKRGKGEVQASNMWTAYVNLDDEPAAMACLERYLASEEVARGVITNPDKWIREESENHWNSTWQTPAAVTTVGSVRRAEVIAGLEVLERIKGRM